MTTSPVTTSPGSSAAAFAADLDDPGRWCRPLVEEDAVGRLIVGDAGGSRAIDSSLDGRRLRRTGQRQLEDEAVAGSAEVRER